MTRLKNQALLLCGACSWLWSPLGAEAQVLSTKKPLAPKKAKPKIVQPRPKAPSPFDLRERGDLRIANLKTRIERLEGQRSQRLRFYKPGAPEIRILDRELAALRRELTEQRQGDFWLLGN